MNIFEAAQSATSKQAPTWPLDQLIAVNPYWERRDQTPQRVTAELAVLGGIRGAMDNELDKSKRLPSRYLQEAALELGFEGETQEIED